MMEKRNFWKIAAIVLLLINISTIGFMWLKRPEKQLPRKPDKLIVEGLHLTKEQVAQFEILKNEHRNGMDSLNQIEMKIRKAIFDEVEKGLGNDSMQQVNLINLSVIRTAKDQITLKHFKDIFQLCDAKQKEYYHATIEKIVKILMRGPGQKPPHPPEIAKD